MTPLEKLWEEIRPVLAKIIGSVMPLILTKLGTLLGMELSQETQELVTKLTWILLMYAITTYGVSRQVNPGNAASPRIVKTEAGLDQSLKRTEKRTEELKNGRSR